MTCIELRPTRPTSPPPPPPVDRPKSTGEYMKNINHSFGRKILVELGNDSFFCYIASINHT